MQLPLIETPSSWTPPRADDLPCWKDAKRVGFDIETCDPGLRKMGPGFRRGAYVAGYSFRLDDGPAYYIPMRHELGDNVEDPRAAVRYLRDQQKIFRGQLVGANLTYDLDGVESLTGRRFRECVKMRCVQVADALINPLHYSYSLDAIAERRGFAGKEESLLKEAAYRHGIKAGKVADLKGSLHRIAARYVGPYAERDVVLPMEILKQQEAEFDGYDLWNIWNLESDLLPVLVKMRRRGIRNDEGRLDEIEVWSDTECRLALQDVGRHTGIHLVQDDLWIKEPTAKILDYLGVSYEWTAGRVNQKTGAVTGKEPRIDDDVLKAVGHPATEALRRARKTSKAGQFITGLRRHMVKGRIHCELKQITRGEGDGARFGRMSCTKPALQTAPAKKTEIGDLIRSAFLPDEGGVWCSADFSAQEVRLAVHGASLYACKGAREAVRAYQENPKLDLHQWTADLIGYDRTYAKAIILGVMYGKKSGSMARDLGLPTRLTENGHRIGGKETQDILKAIDFKLPWLNDLDRKLKGEAKAKGEIRTILGRRCVFPLDDKGRFDWIRTALNRWDQGSAADQTKACMVAADRCGFQLQLQMHDELCQTVVGLDHGKALASVMEETVPLLVPTLVKVETGPNWAAAKKEEAA